MGSCVFPVYVKKSEVVAAVLPMHEHWLPMSNLDLLLPPLDVRVFFCYKKENTDLELNFTPETMVSEIKRALAQALDSFYPLAGEIVQNCLGEPVLFCNNRGVDFVHAYAETELKEIDLHHPDISIEGKLVPTKKQGVLSVQVTELKCGGLVIGCTFDHRAADAHSANLFFTTWAAIAQAKATTYTPILRRSIFNPRNPTQYDSSIDDMYVLISSLPPPKELKACDDELRSRIYYIKGEEIDLLQSEASYNGCRRTRLESFSSFLWKTLAKGECEKVMKFKLGIVVDGRRRLKSKEDRTLSMHEYFGNVISVPYSEASVRELKAMQLKGVANLVHACIESAAKEEHFLGLIDWVELQRPKPAVAKIYCMNSEDEEAIIVSSGLRFPLSQIDFGWGTPHFGSYYFPWGSQTGYVMPMPSASREGDWVVYMYLKNRHLDLVEKQAAHVFRPLSSSYLNINDGLMVPYSVIKKV